MKASVIIPTRNRCSSLRQALESLARQTFPKSGYEILVVDNGSSDATPKVVLDTSSWFLPGQLRYFLEPTLGLLAGRHRGAFEARGEVFVYVDDDIEAEPQWLAAVMECFAEDAQAALVGGKSLPRYEKVPPEWLEGFWFYSGEKKQCSSLSLLDYGNSLCEIPPDLVWGLNFSIRRDAFFQCGGFHPDCIPKDLQFLQGDGESGLAWKVKAWGGKILYQPKACVHHLIPASRLTVHAFRQRFFYQGVADSFTKIRRQNGLYPGVCWDSQPETWYSSETDSPSSWMDLQKNRIRKLLYGRSRHQKLEKIFNQSYRAGFSYHHRCVRRSPEIREWVLKKEYFDWSPPAIGADDAIRFKWRAFPRLHRCIRKILGSLRRSMP